jgi:hypothetical protein
VLVTINMNSDGGREDEEGTLGNAGLVLSGA